MELAPPPKEGRVYEEEVRSGFADCAPSGRVRLDAIARWLQDVAYADVFDAGLAADAVWVVRSGRVRVPRFPRFGERLRARTWCSGLGTMWAERRTTLLCRHEAVVEAVALWVHLDPQTWRPAPFTQREVELYGEPAGGRRVRARLRHPQPPDGAARLRSWTFRAVDCDIAGHVNNAAYWAPVEEELLGRDGAEPLELDAEIEFRGPAQPGDTAVLADGPMRWIVAAASAAPYASIRLA
jgi:acyl-ACP thioesterase